MEQYPGVAAYLVVYLLSKELLSPNLLSPIQSQSRNQITKETIPLLTTRKTRATDLSQKLLMPRYLRIRQIGNTFWGNAVIRSRKVQSKTWTEREIACKKTKDYKCLEDTESSKSKE